MPEFYQLKPEALILSVQVQPGAKKSEFQGITGDGFLKIRVHAPAREGKANQELIEFLADSLGLRKSDFEILSGQLSRKKRLLLATKYPQQILEKIQNKINTKR